MEKARALQPELPEVWNDLAKCWFDMGASYAAANPRSREAWDWLSAGGGA